MPVSLNGGSPAVFASAKKSVLLVDACITEWRPPAQLSYVSLSVVLLVDACITEWRSLMVCGVCPVSAVLLVDACITEWRFALRINL